MLLAFDSNVLTAFLNANSRMAASADEDLAAFRLFLYVPQLTILPTVTTEAVRIPQEDERQEHLKWVWYHFDEAQLDQKTDQIFARAQQLLPHHPQRDLDDCRIVAEAEASGAEVLATIDKKIKRLQPHTAVRLLAPAAVLDYLQVSVGAPPCREPADGHPHAGATWWRI